MKIFLDLETIPDQNPEAVNKIMETLTVKAPDLTKPKLIEALNLDPAEGKFKTVPELKELWLESNGEQAKLDQATEKWLKTSFDGGKGQICCIGVSINGSTQVFNGEEKEALLALNGFINIENGLSRVTPDVEFICHNAKFDIPFLHKRFIINGIKPEFKTNWHGRHGQHHFCTMEEWAGFGNRISQDNLCEILGLPTKPGMTGADVWPEYQAGNIDKIADYCKYDVETVIELHKRLTFGE